MAYTPSGKKTKQAPDNFGGLKSDSNRIAMPYGNSLQSQDAAGTPVTSPQTNLGTSGTALQVPYNAVQLIVSSTVAIQVGEDSSYAQGVNVPANVPMTFDVADQAFIYLKPSNATNTVSFAFVLV